jgi:hypothetical protein
VLKSQPVVVRVVVEVKHWVSVSYVCWELHLVNLSGGPVSFNPGDVVDINIQRVLGSIVESPYEQMQLLADLTHGNPVYDLNDDDPNNDGLDSYMEKRKKSKMSKKRLCAKSSNP